MILSPIEQSIKKKIEAVGTPLKDWDIQINYGIKTGFNDAFIVTTEKRDEILANCSNEDERKRTDALIRPILRGRDIKRYGYEWANLWLINTHNGVKGRIPRIRIEDYPAVKAHLDMYWDKIKDRADQGDTPYNLRNCAYLEEFFKPKIVYMEIQTDNESEGYPFPCFSFDENNCITLNTAYTMSSQSVDVKYILGILNSKLGRFLTKLYVTQLQQRQFRMLAQYVTRFPLPKWSNNKELIDLVNKELHIHSAGSDKPEEIWTAPHDLFLESMADAASSVVNYFKGNIAFINVMMNMSVDCDCCAVAEDPCLKDIGVLASLDPIAIDQACIDLVLKSKDIGREHFMERVNSRNGLLTIEAADKLGFGSREYELIEI